MWLLLKSSSLERKVTNVDITKFYQGSLIINWQITIAENPNSASDLPIIIEEELDKAVKSEALRIKSPLNLQNATVLKVSKVNPCSHDELNYCSENAACTEDDAKSGGFSCICEDDYADASPDINYPGEVCIAHCSAEYCGPHGTCVVKSNDEKLCMCSGWYVGSYCSVPAAVVVAAVCTFNIFLLIILFGFCCMYRQQRNASNFDTPHELEIGMNEYRQGENSFKDPETLDLQPHLQSKQIGQMNGTPVMLLSQHNINKAIWITPSVYSFVDSTFDSPEGSSQNQEYHF